MHIPEIGGRRLSQSHLNAFADNFVVEQMRGARAGFMSSATEGQTEANPQGHPKHTTQSFHLVTVPCEWIDPKLRNMLILVVPDVLKTPTWLRTSSSGSPEYSARTLGCPPWVIVPATGSQRPWDGGVFQSLIKNKFGFGRIWSDLLRFGRTECLEPWFRVGGDGFMAHKNFGGINRY